MTIANSSALLQATEEYLVHYETGRRLSDHTCRAYRTDLEAFRSASGNDADDPKWIVTALRKIIERRGHKVSTIKRRIVVIHGFLNWVDERMALEVFSELKFKMRAPKRLPKAIPTDELNAILAGARRHSEEQDRSDPLYLILALLTSTGLRISELCSLRLPDVDPDKGELKVFGKGAKERMVVIANSVVHAELVDHIRTGAGASDQAGSIFYDARGKAVTPLWVRTRLRRLVRTVGLSRRITPHMFRHTAATLLIEGGVDIRFVQRLLGHSSITTTEIYTHISDLALRTALERADVMQKLIKLPCVQ